MRVRERRTSLDSVPGPVEVEAQVELGNIIVDSEGEGEEDQPCEQVKAHHCLVDVSDKAKDQA